MGIWILKVKESTPDSIVDAVVEQIKNNKSVVMPQGSMSVEYIEVAGQ